jgi:sulfite reductase alpha subunit-like flavoprotein
VQRGLATNYLKESQIGSEVKLQITKNTRVLKLPPVITAQTKLLIVCMGTGVVPFVGMLERL